jgi:hypothetical protein
LDSVRVADGLGVCSVVIFGADEASGDGQTAPDIAFLPPSQRRRLSGLSRISLHLAHKAAAEFFRLYDADDYQPAPVDSLNGMLTDLPCVFGSRHGESQATLHLFDEIVRKEVLSPLVFSRSVHNTAVGLFSIAEGVTASCTALAAMEKTVSATIIEAIGICLSDTNPVLVVIADERIPDFHATFVDDDNLYQGVAFVLCKYQSTANSMISVTDILPLLSLADSAGGELSLLIKTLMATSCA